MFLEQLLSKKSSVLRYDCWHCSFLKCLSHLLFASVCWVNNWMLTKSSVCFSSVLNDECVLRPVLNKMPACQYADELPCHRGSYLLSCKLKEKSQHWRTLLLLSVWGNRKSSCEMFTVLSQGRWAGCTSFFSWLRSILLNYCLFWAQTLNTSVSDGLCKQINKRANIDRSFVCSWAICVCCSCQTSRAIFISVYFNQSVWLYYHS